MTARWWRRHGAKILYDPDEGGHLPAWVRWGLVALMAVAAVVLAVSALGGDRQAETSGGVAGGGDRAPLTVADGPVPDPTDPTGGEGDGPVDGGGIAEAAAAAGEWAVALHTGDFDGLLTADGSVPPEPSDPDPDAVLVGEPQVDVIGDGEESARFRVTVDPGRGRPVEVLVTVDRFGPGDWRAVP